MFLNQEHRNTRIEHRNTPEHRNTETPEHRNTGTPEHRNTPDHRNTLEHRNSRKKPETPNLMVLFCFPITDHVKNGMSV